MCVGVWEKRETILRRCGGNGCVSSWECGSNWQTIKYNSNDINPYTTAPTTSLRRVTLGQLSHSAAKNCLCRKLTETQWRLLSVASLGLNNNSTRVSISSPESLSAVNWFSGGLSFKIMLTASAKEYWREAGSPEKVLGWAFMVIMVQLASLTFEKHGEMAQPVDKAELRLKGRNWPFTSSTYDFLLFHLLKSETGIHSIGSVDFRHLQWWTPCGQQKSPAAVNLCAVNFCHLEWHRG